VGAAVDLASRSYLLDSSYSGHNAATYGKLLGSRRRALAPVCVRP
jgi:hypothetical protein